MMIRVRSLMLLCFGILALGIHGESHAISYSHAHISTRVSDHGFDRGSNSSGAPIQFSADGRDFHAYEAAYASADLSSGQLRGLAGGTGSYINVGSTSAFGDSISVLDANDMSLYSWGSDTSARLSVKISGRVTDTLGVRGLVGSDGTSPNVLYTSLILTVMRPGYLALKQRLDSLYMLGALSDAQWDEITELANDMNALIISRKVGYIGRPVFGDAFNNNYAATCGCIYSINSGSAVVNLDFAPQGNFEFLAFLDMHTSLWFGQGEQTLMQDLSHTVGLEFIGPPGSISFADSGAFPGTVTTIPEPDSRITMALGIIGLTLLVAVSKGKGGSTGLAEEI